MRALSLHRSSGRARWCSGGSTRVRSHGETVEDRARYVAARLGLAGFVYRAQLVNRGAGSREPGDAILSANGRGAVIQVKARDLDAALRDISADKVQRWVDKNGAKAYRQGQGTRRELLARRAENRPVLATPVRAAHLPRDAREKAALVLGMDVANWPTIVVFDHPAADLALAPVPADAFWITLCDWIRSGPGGCGRPSRRRRRLRPAACNREGARPWHKPIAGPSSGQAGEGIGPLGDFPQGTARPRQHRSQHPISAQKLLC